MKIATLVYFLVIVTAANAQNQVEWAENYKLSLSDFRSPSTKVGDGNMYGVGTGVNIQLFYSTTNAGFMVTKNWNDKVKCVMSREAAYIMATNDSMAMQMIALAQLDFDLGELYTRKFRKAIFEEKKWSSSPDLFNQLFDKYTSDYQNASLKITRETDFGIKADLVKAYHEAILEELAKYSEFCKTCVPKKKKRS